MSSVDEARLLALRQRAAGAALLAELATPEVEPANAPSTALEAAASSAALEAATTVAVALAAEGYDLEAAAHGDARALAQRLELAVLGHRQPPTWHAVAVSFERIAEGRTLRERAALLRSALEAWWLLAREGSYLRGLLSRIARPEEAGAVAALVARRPHDVLARWVEAAQPALLAGDVRGAALLRVLRDLEHDERDFSPAAREARESLIDGLLAPLRGEDGERLASRAPSPERVAGFERWAHLWQHTERDTYLATCTLERLVDFGWELRSAGKQRELGQLYRPFREMLEVLVAEVKRGGSAVSYASLVGDAYVQLASSDVVTHERIAHAERALYVCPRHKLAESVLSFYLAQRGLEHLDKAAGIVVPALRTEVESLIVRARQLDPNEARVQLLIDRYRAATGRSI